MGAVLLPHVHGPSGRLPGGAGPRGVPAVLPDQLDGRLLHAAGPRPRLGQRHRVPHGAVHAHRHRPSPTATTCSGSGTSTGPWTGKASTASTCTCWSGRSPTTQPTTRPGPGAWLRAVGGPLVPGHRRREHPDDVAPGLPRGASAHPARRAPTECRCSTPAATATRTSSSPKWPTRWPSTTRCSPTRGSWSPARSSAAACRTPTPRARCGPACDSVDEAVVRAVSQAPAAATVRIEAWPGSRRGPGAPRRCDLPAQARRQVSPCRPRQPARHKAVGVIALPPLSPSPSPTQASFLNAPHTGGQHFHFAFTRPGQSS